MGKFSKIIYLGDFMNNFKLYKNHRKGSTLVLVLIVFAILLILLGTINTLFNSNMIQAVRQERLMKAHYLALSGMEAAKSTLLMPLTTFEGKDINMIEYIKLNPANYSSFSDTIEIDGKDVDITVDYDSDDKVLYITSMATLDEKVKKEIKLRLDVRSKKYVEYWE